MCGRIEIRPHFFPFMYKIKTECAQLRRMIVLVMMKKHNILWRKKKIKKLIKKVKKSVDKGGVGVVV